MSVISYCYLSIWLELAKKKISRLVFSGGFAPCHMDIKGNEFQGFFPPLTNVQMQSSGEGILTTESPCITAGSQWWDAAVGARLFSLFHMLCELNYS